MARLLVVIALIVSALAAFPARAETLPRTVIVVTDGGSGGVAARMAIPALTRLGLVSEVHDTARDLPDLTERGDIAGILIWLDEGRVADGAAFLAWIRVQTGRGLPIAMAGAIPAIEDRFGLFVTLGLLYSVEPRPYTYDLATVAKDREMIEPGRRFGGLWPLVDQFRPLEPPASEAALLLQRGADSTDRTAPVIFTPRAAYIAPGYAVWLSADERAARWMIDPAAFFTRAFHLELRPIPDAGLVNARRVFLPVLAPADAAAAAEVTRTGLSLKRMPPLAVLLDPPGAGIDSCGTAARARLFGYDALLNVEAPGAFAPVVTMCASGAAAARAMLTAAYDYAAAHPLFTAAIRQDALDSGFGAATIEPDGDLAWRIRDRGGVQTVRFDAPGALRLDWTRSEGVLGAARVGGALVASLDPDAEAPLVALTRTPFEPPLFAVLVESRWSVSGLMRDADNVAADVQGYGPGDMVWQVEPRSEWEIRFQPKDGAMWRWRVVVGEDGLIRFSLPPQAANGAALAMERQDYAGAGP